VLWLLLVMFFAICVLVVVILCMFYSDDLPNLFGIKVFVVVVVVFCFDDLSMPGCGSS
jgi:hypothetical protein